MIFMGVWKKLLFKVNSVEEITNCSNSILIHQAVHVNRPRKKGKFIANKNQCQH